MIRHCDLSKGSKIESVTLSRPHLGKKTLGVGGVAVVQKDEQKLEFLLGVTGRVFQRPLKLLGLGLRHGIGDCPAHLPTWWHAYGGVNTCGRGFAGMNEERTGEATAPGVCACSVDVALLPAIVVE